MKRFILSILSLLLLVLSLSACGDTKEPVNLDLSAEADHIISTYSLSGGTRYTSASQVLGEYLDEDLIRSYYGDAAEVPNFDDVESYVVYIDESKPILPCEFGIFKMKEGADADAFAAYLQARIDMKIQNAKAYPSMDTSMLTTAKFTVKDGYIWYCAVKDANDAINSSLESKFN